MSLLPVIDTMLEYFQCPTCIPRTTLAKEINDEPALDITLVITTDLIICSIIMQQLNNQFCLNEEHARSLNLDPEAASLHPADWISPHSCSKTMFHGCFEIQMYRHHRILQLAVAKDQGVSSQRRTQDTLQGKPDQSAPYNHSTNFGFELCSVTVVHTISNFTAMPTNIFL